MYTNPIIEPFTVQTFGGAIYAYPLDSHVSWAVNRVIFNLSHSEQPEQVVVTAEAFLATTPIECYAPLDGDAQDCLIEYLDTTWLSEQVASLADELSDADALMAMTPREYDDKRTEFNHLLGTKYTLDQTRLLLWGTAENQGIDTWLSKRLSFRKDHKAALRG